MVFGSIRALLDLHILYDPKYRSDSSVPYKVYFTRYKAQL